MCRGIGACLSCDTVLYFFVSPTETSSEKICAGERPTERAEEGGDGPCVREADNSIGKEKQIESVAGEELRRIQAMQRLNGKGENKANRRGANEAFRHYASCIPAARHQYSARLHGHAHTHTLKQNVRSVLHHMLHDTHTHKHTDTCTEESKRTRRERSTQNARSTDQARGTHGSSLPCSPPIFGTPRSPLCRAEAESRPHWASRPFPFVLCGAQIQGCSHVSNGA